MLLVKQENHLERVEETIPPGKNKLNQFKTQAWDRCRLGSVCIGPLNPLCIGKYNAKGFRITPCNLSESIC